MQNQQEQEMTRPENAQNQGSTSGGQANSLKDVLEPARTRISQAMTTVQERSNDMVRTTETYIQEYPFRSVAFAAGLGLAIGLLLGGGTAAAFRPSRNWLDRWS